MMGFSAQRQTMLLAVGALLLIVNVGLVNADAITWTYVKNDEHGPEKWHETYIECGRKMQSPIDIVTSKVLYDPNLQLFNLSDYTKTEHIELELENKGGHTAEVKYTGSPIYLRGGSLPTTYKLSQFHFHWGTTDARGSEHTLDGQPAPMEMHLVHFQDELGNSSQAMTHPAGLAVIGFFFKVGKKNPSFDPILQNFDGIRTPDVKVNISTFKLMDLLPAGRIDYFRYAGSLTTPPCLETVIWSVATQKIEISEEQLNAFRSLRDSQNHTLDDTFRPVQPLNSRTILTTDKSYFNDCKQEN